MGELNNGKWNKEFERPFGKGMQVLLMQDGEAEAHGSAAVSKQVSLHTQPSCLPGHMGNPLAGGMIGGLLCKAVDAEPSFTARITPPFPALWAGVAPGEGTACIVD